MNHPNNQQMHGIVERPAEIITISHNATIKAAALKMFTNKVSCLIVNNDNGEFVGVVTERDIVNQVVASSMDIERTTIAEIMTTQVISCSPNTPSSKVREIMTSNQIRHLPIIDDEVVVGILSTRDLMARQLLEDRAAAEEVTMLSTCLKSIDLNEVADIIAREVPKLFGAEKCVLFIRRDGSTRQGACLGEGASRSTTTKVPTLVSYNNCSCPKESLEQFKEIIRFSDEAEFHYDNILHVCEKLGAKSPRLIIPLNVSSNVPRDPLLVPRASSDERRATIYVCAA